MKRILLTLVSPVLALLPAAQADEACKVGKQVFTFVPTGETAYIGETEKNAVERKGATGYLKIPDIRVEKQSGDHFPKDSGKKAADYLEKSSPQFSRYAAKGTKFLKWEPKMFQDKKATKSSVVETTSGVAYIKIGDIKGESVSSRWIDKDFQVFSLKSTCKE